MSRITQKIKSNEGESKIWITQMKNNEGESKNKIDTRDLRPSHRDQIIPQFYEMSPGYEDLVFDGSGLRNGMEVVIESPFERPSNLDSMDIHVENAINLINRWCIVSEVRVDEYYVSFIGIYHDGVKRKRTHPIRV